MLPFCSLTHKWHLVYLFPFQSRGRLRARALSDETGLHRCGLGNCLWALSLRKPVAASCMATAIGSLLRAFVCLRRSARYASDVDLGTTNCKVERSWIVER